MPQAVTVYMSSDAGAPQIGDSRPSDIFNILKKCLVEGYGTKNPLGWSVPFEDTTNRKIAFRNDTTNGGSGGYLSLYSQGANNDMGGVVRITYAKSMTSLDDYIGKGFTQAFVNYNYDCDKWLLVGTSTAFYFFFIRNTGLLQPGFVNASGFFAGDFQSTIPNDAGRFIAFSNPAVGMSDSTNAGSWPWHLAYPIYSSSGNFLKIYNADNSDVFVGYTYNSLFRVTYASSLTQNPDYQTNIVSPFVILTESIPSITNQSVLNQQEVAPYFRGCMPGLYLNTKAAPNDSIFGQTVNIGSVEYLIMPTLGLFPLVMLIKLGVWDEPFTS